MTPAGPCAGAGRCKSSVALTALRSRASVPIVTPDIVGPVRNGGIGTACFHYARALVSAGIETAILYTSPLDAAEGARWKADYASRGIALFTLADLPAAPWKCYSFGPPDERSHGIYRFRANARSATSCSRTGTPTASGRRAPGAWAWRWPAPRSASSPTPRRTAARGHGEHRLDPLLEASIELQEREAIAAA